MKELEFKSSICTSREQSERLLALGLKKETADMVWHFTKSRSINMLWELKPHPPVLKTNVRFNVDRLNIFGHKKADGTPMTGDEYFDELWGKDIPAWSLHRLIELIYGDGKYDMSLETHRPFEDCIERIDYMINQSCCFNKEYLDIVRVGK